MTLEKSWITLASILDMVVQVNGNNDYTIPHMNKDSIIRQHGRLPARLWASKTTVDICKEWDREERQAVQEAQQELVDALQQWEKEEEPELQELEDLLQQEELAALFQEMDENCDSREVVDGENIYE